MELVISWLYFDLMNTYGDRGNLEVLTHRLKERQIKYRIHPFSLASKDKELSQADLFLMGGAEDRQQQLVAQDLVGSKRAILLEKLASGTPGLFICGAYQFLGEYYQTPDGERLTGLELAPLYTLSPSASSKRLVGEIVVQISHPSLLSTAYFQTPESRYLLGFENHGGRTFLKDPNSSLGTVLKGKGNNERDKTEGILFKNTVGTYCHGPILPRNPAIADFLIEKALLIKYNRNVQLKALPDKLEQQNRRYLLNQYNVKI